jgi:benzoyl-CoA reductase/2-hydroxyglutaryl-CoA dehydratase subunit BcrC/BadD/HgdB
MPYTEECQSTLARISADNHSLSSLGFFLDSAAQWHADFDQDRVMPSVVVLGYGIPEQLVYACGTAPYHLLGGSHAACQWSDDVMPRDSDPVSRSILGHALRLAKRSDIHPLFVVPAVNDNLRKISYLLKREGCSVLPVDIPPSAASVSAQRSWEHAMDTLVKTIEQRVSGRSTSRSLRDADHFVGAARVAMVNFQKICAACEGVLSDEAILLVLHTYYLAYDLAQWTAMLNRLSTEVQARHRALQRVATYRPRTLVVGSPILFPQYKVPSLIHDAGMRLLACIDPASTTRFASLAADEREGGTRRLMHAIARKHYAFDASSAHVVNHSMEQYVEHFISKANVEGVVFHILKGQIEYDFMLARLEPLLERHDLPVFRLETDYQAQDVEQLRIRLEAFGEMLEQRAFANGHLQAQRRYA